MILCWQAPASPFWRRDARAKGGGPSPSAPPPKYATACRYVCPLILYLKNHVRTSHNFLCMLTMAVAWSSDEQLTMQHICTSFLQMMPYLPVIGQAKATPVRHILIHSPGSAPGPTQVLNPNCISIGKTVFAGLTTVTDRLTVCL